MSARKKRLRLIAALAALAVASLLAVPSEVHAGTTQTYVVLYKGSSVSSDAANLIANAGGSMLIAYKQIGVAIATSDSSTFRANLLKDNRIAGAQSTAGFGVQVEDGAITGADSALPGSAPATDSDSLSGLQWDMVQIHTPEAHAITGGSTDVLVGDIDTGLDYTHPDLAPNVDSANSANCVSGAPVAGAVAANDDFGHGTHTAGTIAAASNGIGIVGVAPNVKIAGIKAGNADGFFFPEAVICAFMWAGTHGFDVTNNSYFADPWLFNCKNDPDQRAIWMAERRAIQFAMGQGVTVVASAGNQADDLAHPTMDVTSPDDTTPVPRAISNACAVVPAEIPGVVTVAANGNLELKSYYSSYGIGVVDVIAPGGDRILQRTPAAPNGRVLSSWPASLLAVTCAPALRLVDASGATYCYQQGTSMAGPHVAGVAALIASEFGHMMPGAMGAMLTSTAVPMACPPDLSIYAFFPAVDNGAPQVCTGGPAYNSFNGHGQVDALNAIT